MKGFYELCNAYATNFYSANEGQSESFEALMNQTSHFDYINKLKSCVQLEIIIIVCI